jgi:hypothetical protein
MSVQVGGWQIGGLPLQIWSWQSEPTRHDLLSAHGLHASAPMKPAPPQSVSVSFPSFTPS